MTPLFRAQTDGHPQAVASIEPAALADVPVDGSGVGLRCLRHDCLASQEDDFGYDTIIWVVFSLIF
ncbi:hypothetical protein QPK13_23445 [Photorhabdus tasmaniensis]|uniref:hypothetical protein n=1 Tax=Photorhabdus sp. RM323S TaxID=3342828 RepID=UPI0036D7D324